ncbi:hypothetical protein C8R42DRAFT_719401 [Lentinula raphanica]|nr:hypothetical protein C8R42DRAFT_719401 [Lentinula raphanica]
MRELGMDMGNDISDNVHAPSTEEQAGLAYPVDAPAGFHAAMISPPPPPPPGIDQWDRQRRVAFIAASH